MDNDTDQTQQAQQDTTTPAPQDTTTPNRLPSYPTPTTTTTELPSAFSLFKPSIEALKLNLWTYLSMYGILLIMGGLLGFMSTPSNTTNSATELGAAFAVSGTFLVLGLAFAVYALLVSPAITYIQLQSAKGNRVAIGEALKTGLHFIVRYVGLAFLVAFLIVGGLILFIVPGLIMIRRYYLSMYYLIDQDLGILEAMRRSAQDSKAQSGKVWGVIGVTFLCGLPSAVPVIGTIIGGVLQILYSFAPAIRYHQIKEAAPKS